MSLLDPIDSAINSLLDPVTSALLPEPASTQPARTSPTKANSPSTPTSNDSSPETSAVVITPSSVDEFSTSQTRASTTSHVDSSTRSAAASSSLSSSSSLLPSTLSTSTRDSTSNDATIVSVTSTQTSVPAAPTANTPNSTTNNNTTQNSSTNTGISTAGIAIAIVFAVAIVISIIVLTVRFCPPVRRRFDAWRDRGREERTYREALDGPGPAISEKDDAYSFSSAGSLAGKVPVAGSRPSTAAAHATTARGFSPYRPEAASKEILAPKKPAASYAHEKSTSIPCELDTNQPWQMSERGFAGTPVHQQYVSPISANSDDPRGNGLGLGRVSFLRNESPVRHAEYDVPPSAHGYGSSMDGAQTGIAMVGVGAGAARSAVSGDPDQMGVKQVEVKRKPIAARIPPVARPFSYELPVVSQRVEQPHLKWNMNSSTYRNQAHRSIKEEEMVLEQIGMAVSSTPQLTQQAVGKTAR